MTPCGVKTQDLDSDCLRLNPGSAVVYLWISILLGLNFLIRQLGTTIVPAPLIAERNKWEITLKQHKYIGSFEGTNGTCWAG